MNPQSEILRFAEATPDAFREGCERRILHTSNLMLVIIDFNNGPWAEPDPFHSHPHEQVTYIAEGDLLFLAEGQEPRRLGAGDMFAVPSGQPHSIHLLSSKARLIDSFNPLRDDFLKK